MIIFRSTNCGSTGNSLRLRHKSHSHQFVHLFRARGCLLIQKTCMRFHRSGFPRCGDNGRRTLPWTSWEPPASLATSCERFSPRPGLLRGATVTLANVVLKLDEVKLARARRTALVNLLDNLGIALALCDEETLCAEAGMLRGVTRVFALGRY